MKDIDLSSMISRAKIVFDILEKEYKVFLSSEKKEMIENIIYSNLFKVCENTNLPPVYLSGDTYYLNRTLDKEIKSLNDNSLYSKYLKETDINDIYLELVIFLCLSMLCSELNPLKKGLIELEVRKISSKYNIKTSSVNNYKELEVATLVHEKLLNDVPFNIIFKDSDIEIFYYLGLEKGIEVAKLYHEISSLMKKKFKKIETSEFSLKKYLVYYESINYEDEMDLIYNYINEKIR